MKILTNSGPSRYWYGRLIGHTQKKIATFKIAGRIAIQYSEITPKYGPAHWIGELKLIDKNWLLLVQL